jgi:hypothetical protein
MGIGNSILALPSLVPSPLQIEPVIRMMTGVADRQAMDGRFDDRAKSSGQALVYDHIGSRTAPIGSPFPIRLSSYSSASATASLYASTADRAGHIVGIGREPELCPRRPPVRFPKIEPVIRMITGVADRQAVARSARKMVGRFDDRAKSSGQALVYDHIGSRTAPIGSPFPTRLSSYSTASLYASTADRAGHMFGIGREPGR